MFPSISDLFLEKTDQATSPSVLEVEYLSTRWRQIKSQLLYADLFEGSLLNRLKSWHQLQKACQIEKKNYQSHHQYKVPNHILKKDLMELFYVPFQNIVVDPEPFHRKNLASPPKKLTTDERSMLRRQLNVEHDDLLIYLADEPNLQNGLYQALSTMKYFKDQKVNHLKLLLSHSYTTVTIKRQLKELGISSVIVLANESEEPFKLLSACDIAFLPALYAPHTPSLLKAMVSGRPVVLSSEVGGIEMHLKRLSPYVFPAGSQASIIANCLLPLLRSQNLRQQIGEENAKAVQDQTQTPILCDLGLGNLSRVDPPKA